MLRLPPGCEPYARQHRSHGDYAHTCERDVAQISPHLVPGDVLDIGCGLGGPSVLIQRLCGGRLYLMDGDGWASRRVGFGPDMAPFNDLALTASVMALNGIQAEFVPIEASIFPKVQNVVSLLSWGWHYPVETYLDPVLECLAPDGRLVIDIRAKTYGQKALMEAGLRLIELIDLSPKGKRTLWSR
jgi:SAM-dependent methyltransferase